MTALHDAARGGRGGRFMSCRLAGQHRGLPLKCGRGQFLFTGIEIGWRLARSAWGHGYATEAALASLAYDFETLALPEIVAVTTATNLRSQAVMRRIGMTRDPAEDFDDPAEPEGPLRRNVLYRIRP